MAPSPDGSIAPPLSVRLGRWLRRLADGLDPFGSGDLRKMGEAGDRAMARLHEHAAKHREGTST